jgi:molybdopterin-guanine dinucleotide biosynthesis protein A
MFTPCRITTRPFASVIQRPDWLSGALGAAAAGAADSAVNVMAMQRALLTRLRSLPLSGPSCSSGVIGAVLAGGEGRRLGAGSKAAVLIGDRPLVSYPLAALAAVCERVAVVCKPDTQLPDLGVAERWDEPAEPRHPLTGIVHALERARAPVLVCAADMPFVTAHACQTLLAAGGPASPAAVAVSEAVLQPVLGVYSPDALKTLREAPEGQPLTVTVEALDPVRVALPAAIVRSVNTPDDLAEAKSALIPGS